MNQNMMIFGQNLTGMTYLQFFGHNTSLKGKSILETNKTLFVLTIHISTHDRQMIILFLVI